MVNSSLANFAKVKMLADVIHTELPNAEPDLDKLT